MKFAKKKKGVSRSLNLLAILVFLLGTIIKRTVHNNFAGLFFGLPFTKRNLEFTKMVKDKFSAESKLLVVCQEGLRLVNSAVVDFCHAFSALAVSSEQTLGVFT